MVEAPLHLTAVFPMYHAVHGYHGFAKTIYPYSAAQSHPFRIGGYTHSVVSMLTVRTDNWQHLFGMLP